ncbi:MAG: GNAT family N-acetyltransferase [Clostridia bacterium]|nr:GNAT family N-acetyltransferase [Clostridia bacterium]MBR3681355.1 GNAT family N-acetyltransferase [Clostridia bacterium]
MISFINVKDDGGTRELLSSLPAELLEYGELLLEDFRAIAEEIEEAAVCVSDGCMLVRVLDGGEYMFIFPIMLSAEGDTAGALLSLSEYVRRELLPFLLTDVPREGLGLLCEVFAHVDARAYADDEDTFAAIVKNELDLIEEYPTVELDGLTLSPLADGDAADYARLCSDGEANKYWGFDDLADNPTGDPEIFMLIAEREKRDGIALSLAIRRAGKYIGEAVIYNCDFKGEAEIGIRILSEYRGAGVGVSALDALLNYCKKIGILAVRARVRAENTPAIRMTEKRLAETKREDGVVYFFAPVGGFELG